MAKVIFQLHYNNSINNNKKARLDTQEFPPADGEERKKARTGPWALFWGFYTPMSPLEPQRWEF